MSDKVRQTQSEAFELKKCMPLIAPGIMLEILFLKLSITLPIFSLFFA